MAALYSEGIGLHNFDCVLGTLWQELRVACPAPIIHSYCVNIPTLTP